jgi:hypothetical protein
MNILMCSGIVERGQVILLVLAGGLYRSIEQKNGTHGKYNTQIDIFLFIYLILTPV